MTMTGVLAVDDVIPATAARRIRVSGLVQGVGFRPFVHRLALRHTLDGWVLNSSGAVTIHVEGCAPDIEHFLDDVRQEAPVLARIESMTSEWVVPEGVNGFEVRASVLDGDGKLPVSPDVAMCEACARELADPRDRRFNYPFITCTDCGPRFTVIESMPYDRERTTMRAFTQCPDCRREYLDPRSRRYHSETNSCPACGPTLWFEPAGGTPPFVSNEYALGSAARMLREGGIVAVRGLGGFQLAVDATNGAAVERLRTRKHREAKPLALMTASLDDARRYVELTPRETQLLTDASSPIVLARRRAVNASSVTPIAPDVAPGLAHLGVMLASTPLHLLLLRQTGRPLVMTSGNRSEEPIATGIDEARERLHDIADAFLFHDREIVARYDDSVVRVVDNEPVFLRRARGYAPKPIDFPVASPQPLLAVGPHLKNTFTLMEGRRAWVSQHIGDLETLESFDHFHAARQRFETLFRVRPEVIAHDRHPGYLSTRLAVAFGLRTIAVQHHHAHIAAVLAELGRTDPVIGIAYDGTGYGDDGCIWGGEILYADLAGYRRLGHLRYAPMPGGDAAARAPWRAALGFLSLEPTMARVPLAVDASQRTAVERQLERRINAPLASSMGRLFDAAAAILGVRTHAAYEGQAAMELEALAGNRRGIALPYQITRSGGCAEFDPLPLLGALAARVRAGADPGALAAAFHQTIVAATVNLADQACRATGCRTVALAGGCFQNARLLSLLRQALRGAGFTVLVPRDLAPNDGAISAGQAAVAAATLSGMKSAATRQPATE